MIVPSWSRSSVVSDNKMMYETHHTVDDVEEGHTILWNGHEYTVTEVTDRLIKLDDRHTLDHDTAQRWFKSEDVPFEIKYQ